jgi:hypothetical protein
MTSHRVLPTPVRDILWVEDLSTIWRHFHWDMMMLMHHIFGSINLIETLRGVSHDPTTSSSLTELSTSSTPPHGPPPPPNSPPRDLDAPSTNPLDSPPHVF